MFDRLSVGHSCLWSMLTSNHRRTSATGRLYPLEQAPQRNSNLTRLTPMRFGTLAQRFLCCVPHGQSGQFPAASL